MDTPELDGSAWVSLVTFGPDGQWQATPVWIEGRNGLFAVTCDDRDDALERLRADPVFEVLRCDLRGRPVRDATLHRGVATIIEGRAGRRSRRVVAIAGGHSAGSGPSSRTSNAAWARAHRRRG